MNRDESRKARRGERAALKAAGIAAYSRVVIEASAIRKAQETGVDLVDIVMLHIDMTLHELIGQGGDVLDRTVITIGAHPDFPDAVTIEAKVASLVKPADEVPGG